MATLSLFTYALLVGVVSGVIAYSGALLAEIREKRRSAARRERKVQGM